MGPKLALVSGRVKAAIGFAYSSRWTAWAIVLAGAFLRINRYLLNRSLWLDEAYIALNLVNRSLGQLLAPLDYGQAVPIGFLMLEKAALVAFGNRETTLRLIPLLASLAALGLFCHLARQCVDVTGFPIALVLFAVSDSLGDYSAQVKPYSLDVFFSILLILAMLRLRSRKPEGIDVVWFGVLGALAVWFSHAASLVLIGIGATIAVSDGIGRRWRRIVPLLPAFAAWGASFAASYLVSLRGILAGGSLTQYWQDRGAFAQVFPISLRTAEDLAALLGKALQDPLGFPSVGVAAVCLLIGVVWMLEQRRETLFLLLSGVIVAFCLSGLRLYPFASRLLLFAVPLLVVPIAQGAGMLIGGGGRLRWMLAAGLLPLLLYQPMKLGVSRGVHPRLKEEMRPVVAYLESQYIDGQEVYLYYASQYAFYYYIQQMGVHGIPVVAGQQHGGDPSGYLDEIAAAGQDKMIWVVFSHKLEGRLGDEEQYILAFMDCAGIRKGSVQEVGASAYLYDLSPAATSPDVISSCLAARSG